jgi:hypothetical protein
MADSAPNRDCPDNPRLFLLVATVAAWFPICRPYLRMGDDFHFALWLLSGGIAHYFHENGVWRILGHETGALSTLANPLLPGLLATVTHTAAALLFLAVLRQLLSSKRLALLLALIFAVFPWGDTALMWACEYTYLLSTTLFLAVLCLLLRVFPLKDSAAVPLCILVAALSLFSHEALFFAMLISGGVVLLRDDGRPLKQRIPLAVAPAIGCCIWWVLYKIFPGRIPVERIKLDPRTLLSGIYYQYTNLWIFQPWASHSIRALLFFAWSWWQFAVAVILVCAVLFCFRRFLPRTTTNQAQAIRDNRMLIFLLVLLVATVAIYSIGGGFSLDSRKKYPIIPVLLMTAGYCIDRYWPRSIPPLRLHRVAILAVTVCGIATTWLQIALWRYEATRLDLLVDFLQTQPDQAAVQVHWDSRIQAAWPHADQFWGAPVEDWVRANAVDLKNLTSPPAQYSPAIEAVKFNPETFRWQPASP